MSPNHEPASPAMATNRALVPQRRTPADLGETMPRQQRAERVRPHRGRPDLSAAATAELPTMRAQRRAARDRLTVVARTLAVLACLGAVGQIVGALLGLSVLGASSAVLTLAAVLAMAIWPSGEPRRNHPDPTP